MSTNITASVSTKDPVPNFDTRYYVGSFSDLPYEKLFWTTNEVKTVLVVLLTVLGVTSNILNILVFVKMGLRETVIISLLALSISDLAYLVVQSSSAAVGFVDFFLVRRLGVKFSWSFDERIMSYPFYWYGAMFYEASTLIIVYIAVVRSACVAMPLKVKTIFTVPRTIITLGIILGGCFLLRLPTFLIHSVVSEFHPSTNKTRPTYKELDDGGVASAVNDIYNRNILPWFSFIVVLASVIVMAVKLQESAKFRSSASSKTSGISTKHDKQENNKDSSIISQKAEASGQKLSAKEVQIVRSVVLVASVFIACQTPYMIQSLVRRLDPRFDLLNSLTELKYPKHLYLYAVSSNISQLFAYVNSSVNILVYLWGNTRYRECFKSLWKRKS